MSKRNVPRCVLLIAFLGLTVTTEARSRHHRKTPKTRSVVAPKIVIRPGHTIRYIPRGAISVLFAGTRLYIHDGVFYRWQSGRYVIVLPPIGVTVPVLPSGCTGEVVAGETYFVIRDTYYRKVPNGFLVVRRPSASVVLAEDRATPAGIQPEVVTVWIQNANESRTPVEIRRAEDGQWIGPKGEYYVEFPAEAQLLSLYGLPGAQ